jgi:hypothetical protein
LESSAYITQVASARLPSALEIAALHQQELELEAEISNLRYGDGPAKVKRLVEELFVAIKSGTRNIADNHDFGIECGWTFVSGGQDGSCVLKTSSFGIVVNWHRPTLNATEDATLGVRHFEGRLFLPGEFQGGVHIHQPRLTSEVHYDPTLSRYHRLGWVQRMKANSEPAFLSNDALAESCLSQMLNTLRRHHQKR